LRNYESIASELLRQTAAPSWPAGQAFQIVGDRFVFQSEVLFGVSSSELTPAGIAQMTDLAANVPYHHR